MTFYIEVLQDLILVAIDRKCHWLTMSGGLYCRRFSSGYTLLSLASKLSLFICDMSFNMEAGSTTYFLTKITLF